MLSNLYVLLFSPFNVLCQFDYSDLRTPVGWGIFPLLFHGGSEGKVSAYKAGDLGSILGSGISPGEGNDNPLQHSCLVNPTDGGV